MLKILVIAQVLLLSSWSKCEPVSVSRDKDGDKVKLITQDKSCREEVCSPPNVTYLEDRGCVNDVAIGNQYCKDHYLAATPNFLDLSDFRGTLVVFDGRNNITELSNNQRDGNCTISRLSVIRNLMSKEMVIGSRGFTIISRNFSFIMQVHETSLMYSREEYDGEVYYMTFNCTSNPYCVVFKLNGTTDLRKGKFNESTLSSQETTFCSLANTLYLSPTTSNNSISPKSGNGFLNDPILRYIIIGTGCTTGVLICIISIFFYGICSLCVKRKRVANNDSQCVGIQYAGREQHLYYPQDNVQVSNGPEAFPTVETKMQIQEERAQKEEDNTYAIVEDVQAEVEEFRQKKIAAAKFRHASATFNTFKPVEGQPTHFPVSRPELDVDPQRDWLPGFSRNHNSLANQAHLMQCYETVTVMPQSENRGNKERINNLDHGTDDKYDKLYQERKPKITPQKKISLSSSENPAYSELNLQEFPQLQPGSTAPNDAEQKAKPKPKTRTNDPNPLSSYTTVKKLKTPSPPPAYNPRKRSMVGEEEEEERAEEEEHYMVPRKVKNIRSDNYDHLSGLIQVAGSCDNLKSTLTPAKVQIENIYDRPSSIFPNLVHKRGLIVLDEALLSSLESLVSQDSYMQMSATHV